MTAKYVQHNNQLVGQLINRKKKDLMRIKNSVFHIVISST